VADYAAEILPPLAALADVALVEPPGWQAPAADEPWLALPRLPATSWSHGERLDVLHLGNNPYHLWVAARLRRRGGVVVLHDPVLHHLLVEEAAAEEQWERFAAELETAHPGAGQALAAARRWGYTGRLDPFLFPAQLPLLRHARGVIVHSHAAAKAVGTVLPALPVRTVPLAVGCLARQEERRPWRQRLGAADGELLLLHLGFLTPAKGLEVILRALAALRELGVACRLVVVGEGSDSGVLDRRARGAGLGALLVSWGFASRDELAGLLAAADLGLVPRYPTAGETSAAALRFLAAGVPVIVSGYRQFLELPAAAALRVPPGESGVADMVRHVAALAAHPAALAAAREAARRAWVEGRHEPAAAAAALLSALQAFYNP
jgi:glycosyltransferase involved in cell wall biosynthesis